MRLITDEKFESLLQFLQEKRIDILLISDFENSENVNLQYLSGHPTDAFILITSSGESVLIPWDVVLAKKHSEVDEIIDPFNFMMGDGLNTARLYGPRRWCHEKIQTLFPVRSTLFFSFRCKCKHFFSAR